MKNETIVDRVVDRLKTQPLGDLITEEDLHDIVKQAIPRAFFEKRKTVTGSGYQERVVDSDPVIVEVMRDLMRDSAKTALQSWLSDNAEMVAQHWKSVIDAGLLTYVQTLQNEMATSQVRAALVGIMQTLNNERQKSGLAPIYL